MKKKIFILFVISVAMLLLLLPNGWKGTEAQAASHTVDEAMAWCESNLNQTIGTGQCVPFVQAYYSYLGVTPSTGDAYQFATNALPSISSF